MMDDWDLHDTAADENLEFDIMMDQELERARMLSRGDLDIGPPVIERGCWAEHDGMELVVLWPRLNGDTLVRHLHGERWLLGLAPISELTYLRPSDATSEHVLTLQGQWGKADGPYELTWLEVQAGLDRAEQRVAKWPQWMRDWSPYDAVGRLMTDYRDVVRQRDRLAHELGTIEWQTRLLLVRVCEIEERVSASRIGRAALSVAKACGVLAGAFKRRRG